MVDDRSDMRVLIADDHERFRSSLRALLSSLDDVEVIADVADGNAAVSLAGSIGADVVVLDLYLPGINGLDAARCITGFTPAPAVVVVSMDARPEARALARRAGAFDFVAKGSDPQVLVEVLQAAFRSSQPNRDLRPMTPGTPTAHGGGDPADSDEEEFTA